MQQGEVMTHAGIYLASLMSSVFKDILVKALVTHLGLTKKSCFDDSLAAIANSIAIECSDCKNVACWNPCPDAVEVTLKSTAQEDVVIK